MGKGREASRTWSTSDAVAAQGILADDCEWWSVCSPNLMDSMKCIGFQIFRNMKKRKAKCSAKTLEKTTSIIDEISPVESLEYDFITIQNATNNFSEANKIGEGGFGVVYKGTLEDGQQVAVKRLFKNLRKGNLEFKNEVALMAKFQHRNLVRLLGYCQEEGKNMLLVYEFAPDGGLDNILSDPAKRECLDWKRRYKIIECIARGLIYLHEGSRLRIIHCNLKASNVLLDEDLNPKIADFDMTRLFALEKTHGSKSRIVGTRYIAPEYVLQGEISIKTDVYSFGVLVLEIISGQEFTNFQNEESINDFLRNAWTHWKGGYASNVIDPIMLGRISTPVHEITKCIHIAFLCVQESVADRPTMNEVLRMLSNLFMRLPLPLVPGFFIHGNVSSEASSQSTKNEMSISDQYHRKMRKRNAKSYAKSVKELSDGINLVESHVKYEFTTLQNATDNFSNANKLGGGGFGVVYKGKLENMQLVAVKRLPINLKLGNAEFKSQVALMTNLQHKNLVRLLGFCHEGEEMILVYEFVPNGSLDDMLFHPVKCGYLNWGRRYEIIESIGKGLVYLHEDSRLRIVHRDLKTSNILLDVNLNPKIADFNLAYSFASDKALGFKDKWSGSLGYAPPECSFGEFSIKSDVYSFGILVLEIISKQKCFNLQIGGSIEYLSSYVWKQWTKGSSLNVIDPMLTGISSPVDDIIKCIQVALLCVQENAKDRPTMGEVVQMLSNLSSVSLPVPSVPPHLLPSPPLLLRSPDSSSDDSVSRMSISDGEYPR